MGAQRQLGSALGFTSSGDPSPHRRGSSWLQQFLFPRVLLLHVQTVLRTPHTAPTISVGQEAGVTLTTCQLPSLGTGGCPLGLICQ